MTNEKTEKVVYETPSGKIFDVEGAFERHPAITPGKANIDLWVTTDRHGWIYFDLRLSAETMARLVQILNAAPVDGNPLNAIVNLEIDSTASDYAREKNRPLPCRERPRGDARECGRRIHLRRRQPE